MIELEAPLTQSTIAAVVSLYGTSFDDHTWTELPNRLATRDGLVAWLAYRGDALVGFKLGYPSGDEVFYSWLGGVEPAHRRKGIATDLMTAQHRWCAEQGYMRVWTRSLVRYEAMVSLNLAFGFMITNRCEERGQRAIYFEMQLT
ncbi:MAG: GNAT family N-acetyltransferase [Pseudomonadota bacterium]